MNLMKKSFSLLLAVAMVFTATFGCMTVSSFAADSGTGSGAEITGFTFDNVEGPASGEAKQTISLNVEFSKDIKVLDAEKAAKELNIKISGGDVRDTSRDITVSASGKVLNIKMVSNGWVAIYGGTLSVEADSISNIVNADDNTPVNWDEFTTYIPIGITLDNQTTEGTADAAASDTVKVTHKANMRGMYHFQLMSNGEPVLGNTSDYWYAGAMTSHAHAFNTSITEKTIASAMASAINRAECGYTAEYQDDTDTFTVTARDPKAGEIITVQMLEANSDLRDQKALLNEAKARVDAVEVKTEAANNALAAYNAFIASDDSAKTQMAYAKVTGQLLKSVAPAEFDEGSAAVLDGSGIASIDLISLPEGWADAVKTITVKEYVKDAVEKTYTKEEAGFSIYTGRWGSSIDLNSKLFESSNKRNTFVVTVKADGFEDASGYIDVNNYGAEKFYLRYIDKKTGNVIRSRAYTMDQLKSFSKVQNNAIYQTYCSMAGLRNFCADGVLLEDLMADAGITGKAGMTVQVRTNDSAKPESGNDSETDNAYYRMGSFNYEDLFSDRYYFPAVFTDEALKAKLSASDAKFVGNGSEETRTALGSSEGKVAVRPMIAWNYDEKVFKSDTSMPSSANYSDRTQNERAFRFLYGIGMESDNVTANETTTWSATYCAFGVDIIDPDYTGPEPDHSTGHITGFSFDNIEGPASGEAGQTISLNVEFSKDIKVLDAEKAADELNIKIAGGDVKNTARDITVSASGNTLNIKMVSNGWAAIYGGTLSVDADSIKNIVDDIDNAPVEWDAFTTYIPIGITLDNQTKAGTADAAASDTVKVTHKANMRGMYHFQLMSNGEPVLGNTSGYWYAGAMTSHAHAFNTSITEKTIASAMANAINSANCGYTAEYQADTDTFTVTAKTPKAGEVITVQMLEANSDLRDQKALLNEAKARVDAVEVKTEAANNALAAYNAFIALDDSAKTQMAYAKVVSQLLKSVAPAEFDEDATAVLDGSGVTSIDLASLPEGWADAVKTITVKENVKDAVEKTYTKEEAGFSIYTGRWGSSVDLNSSLFESANKKNTFVVTVKADGFEDSSAYVSVKNYGADKFYVRYIDGKTGNVIKSKAYTKEELKNFSNTQKNAMYQTYCSMAGLRNFCADGVLLEDLMADAGITGKAGMTVQVRTNDSAADESGNDSETDNAYYRMGKFNYEDLFSDRYYFPAVFTDEALKAKLSASDAKFVGNGSEETRTALGSSEGKIAVRPMIAWNYDEKVFKSDTSMPSSENYSDRTENERAFRFLYGIGMESDNVTKNETTTWSATYCAFGVDIIDPNYTKPSSGGSSSGSSTTVTPATKYTVSKPADTAEGKVSVSPSTAEKGDTVTITVTPANGYKTGTVTVTDKNGSKVSVSGSENKYTFKMPASAVTVKVTYEKTAAVEQPAQTAELPFKDVKADRWSYGAIKYAYENKLFSGTSNDQFSPTDKMTRGMLVTVLYRLAGEPDVNGAAGFNDINSGDWYAKAVAWAKANNIVSGVSANEFAPNNEITREQMATILYRYASFKGLSTTANGNVAGFNDNSQVSGFAKDALSWAVGEKLISGTGNNTLAPKGDATREQVATILQRFAENIAK